MVKLENTSRSGTLTYGGDLRTASQAGASRDLTLVYQSAGQRANEPIPSGLALPLAGTGLLVAFSPFGPYDPLSAPKYLHPDGQFPKPAAGESLGVARGTGRAFSEGFALRPEYLISKTLARTTLYGDDQFGTAGYFPAQRPEKNLGANLPRFLPNAPRKNMGRQLVFYK